MVDVNRWSQFAEADEDWGTILMNSKRIGDWIDTVEFRLTRSDFD